MIKKILFYQLIIINNFSTDINQLSSLTNNDNIATDKLSSAQKNNNKIFINKLFIVTRYLFFKKDLNYYKLLFTSFFFFINAFLDLFIGILIKNNNIFNKDITKTTKIIIFFIAMLLSCFVCFILNGSLEGLLSFYDADFNDKIFYDRNLFFQNSLEQQISHFNKKNLFLKNKKFLFINKFINIKNIFKPYTSKKLQLLIDKKKNYLNGVDKVLFQEKIYKKDLEPYNELQKNIFFFKNDYKSIYILYEHLIFFNLIFIFMVPQQENFFQSIFVKNPQIKFFYSLIIFVYLILRNCLIANSTAISNIMFFLYDNPKIYNTLIENPKFIKYINIIYKKKLQSYILSINNPLFFKKTKIFNNIKNIDFKKNIQ